MTSPLRVGVLSRSFSRHPVLRDEIGLRCGAVTFNDTGRTLGGDELIAFLGGHDAAVVALERIDESVFARLPDLRIVSKYGVGLDNVDLHAAARHGVKVGWTGGVNRRSVAELTIAFAIHGLRGIGVSAAEVRAGVWRQVQGRQLSDCTVGLVGFGHVGQEVARLLGAFGTKVIAHDIRMGELAAECAALAVESVELDALLARADVVSLHLPLTPATRVLLDASRLRKMKRGAVLINTARGGLVDEAALEAALDDHLAAACFDVFASEPPDRPALLARSNFLATAHIGGSAAEAVLAMGRAAIAGLSTAIDPLGHIPSWAE